MHKQSASMLPDEVGWEAFILKREPLINLIALIVSAFAMIVLILPFFLYRIK